VLAESLADLGSFVASNAHCVSALRLATEIDMSAMIPRCHAHLEAFDHPAFG